MRRILWRSQSCGTNNFGNGFEIGLCNGLLNRNPPLGRLRFSSYILPFLSLLRSDDLAGIGSADAVLAGHRDNRGDIPESPQRPLAQSSGTLAELVRVPSWQRFMRAVLGRLRTATTSYISGRPKAATKPASQAMGPATAACRWRQSTRGAGVTVTGEIRAEQRITAAAESGRP